MGTSENENLLRTYMEEVWRRGDLAALQRFLDPSFRRHISPTHPPLNRDQQMERLRGISEAFPDVTVQLEDVVAARDLVSFRSTLRGTHRGDFLGLPPTGRRVTVTLVDLWRVADGRVMEQWGGPDLLDLARQLGARLVASPDPATPGRNG